MARRDFDGSFASRIPGVASLAAIFRRLAAWRRGPVPVGLLLLVPVALAIDLVDIADELGGPLGIVLSFLLEAAFLLGLTGRASYAFGFAGIDLVPFVDTIPFATLVLLREISRSWGRPARDVEPPRPEGPIIDV